MMWGPRKSNEWLASMFAGFFQSVLVIQPLKAVVVAILLAAIFRTPVKQEPAEESPETPRVCGFLLILQNECFINTENTQTFLK